MLFMIDILENIRQNSRLKNAFNDCKKINSPEIIDAIIY